MTTTTTDIVPDVTDRARLTIEQALYFLLAMVAAILRLGRLGETPLSPSEAENALAVWQFWQTASAEALMVPASPAYFSLTALLTPVIGFSDISVRLIPALAGIGMILALFPLRSFLGRFGGIVAAVLLAVSPTLTVASRTAGGDVLAMLAALLLVGRWWRFRRDSDGDHLYWVIGLTAFGLTTAPIFYGFLLTFALACGLEYLLGPSLSPPNRTPIELTPELRRTGGIIAAMVLFLSGTFFVTNLSGLTGVANLLVTWLSNFRFSSDILLWLEPLFALSRYELLALVLGLTATIWATWVGEPRGNFFAYWYVIVIALMVVQVGYLANVMLLTLPAYLLVGRFAHIMFVQSDWSWRFDPYEKPSFLWPLTFLLIALALVIAINLGRYARVSLYNADDVSNLLLAFICLSTMIFMWLIITVWDQQSAWTSGILLLITLAVILNWGMSWRLGVVASQDTRERWIVEAADDELPLLVEAITEVANETGSIVTSTEIYSTIDHPLVRWYLRDLDNITYGTALPNGATPALALTADTSADNSPAFGSDYIGTDFGFIRTDNDTLQTNANVLRWWFFAQSFQEIPEERVVLWLRTDLIGVE